MKIKPTVHVNFHGEQGRGMFQLDLQAFSDEQLEFVLRVFKLSDQGVEFGIEKAEDGRYAMRFTLGIPAAERVQ